MPGLPFKCGKCGHAFASRLIIVEGGLFNTFGAFEEDCPIIGCGGIASNVPGTYSNVGQSWRVDQGNAEAADLVHRVNELIAKAKASAITAEEILTEIAGISPELAQKVRSRGLPIFAIVLLLIWLIKGVNFDIKVDLNRLIDQAIEISTGADPERLKDASPPSTEPGEPTGPERPTWAEIAEAPLSRRARRRIRGRSKKPTSETV